MNTPAWYIGKNTDFELHGKMQCLAASFGDVELYYPRSWWRSLSYNIRKVARHFLHKIGMGDRHKPTDGWILRQSNLYNEGELDCSDSDMIYSQGILPSDTHGKPVLVDLIYLNPEDMEDGCSEKAKESFAILTEQVRHLAQIPGIFNVRSDHSLKMIDRIVPEQSWKFRNLPFLMPNLKVMDTNAIIRKHQNTECIEFLFCGAQAIRKGLPLVIDAFIRIRREGRMPCRLHIVSALSDGHVDIPQDKDIVLHGALPYNDTQKLFEQCHVFVMPSISESYGLTYLEAMARGAIVIARDYEPQREIVGYGECGLLTKPDAEHVYRRMAEVMNMDAEERVNLALKARERFIKKYSYDYACKEWYKAIKDVYSQI